MSETLHSFKGKTVKLRDLLPLIRLTGYSNKDEGGKNIKLCPECEEWTHVTFNENSGFLDLLGDLKVSSIDADEDDIILWIETDDYNWFNIDEKEKGDCDGTTQ